MQLDGKVAIVTGAGRGIGRAIAMAYGQEGAAVCCAARTNDQIEETARQIEAGPGRALAVETDVTDSQSVSRMVEATADEFGGLDIIVVNAGAGLDRGRSVEDSDIADWRATVEVNLMGAYYCVKSAIPHLKQRGAGKIITMGSGNGHRGRAGGSAYGTTKAALWMLTRILAQELWEYNISVNELIPGPVRTEMTKQAISRPGSVFSVDSEWVKNPEDVVPLALFMATQPDKGPTGQTFSLLRRDM
jgi:3-oxoacyl-[acyl-carrier protein] reductase